MFRSKTVLVTGAGGSIGSELVVRLCQLGAARVVALDISEFNLWRLQERLHDLKVRTPVQYLLCDVRNRFHVSQIFFEHKPDVVYHAAALKHVPLLENMNNTLEAFLTNIHGTRSVLDAVITHRVPQFLLISTDKAVAPLSMMGASKAYAEGYCREVAMSGDYDTQVVIVRFGNVVGSSGSVTPLWEKQIANGGPLTITDTRMVRWFMQIPDAVDLVVHASELAQQEFEPPLCQYMLDMGDPVNLLDLAKRLIDGRDILIEEIGIRPGEKLVEELRWPFEATVPTEHPKVVQLIALPDRYPKGFLHEISQLELVCQHRHVNTAKEIVANRIGYQGDLSVV